MTVRVLICRSNPIAPDPRVEKIARALKDGGYAVQLLGWDMSGNFPLEANIDNIPIWRCRIVVKPVKGLGNLIYALRWQASLMGWLARHHRGFDAVHACDFDTVLPALTCRWLWGKKVVYDIFDFYADMLRLTPNLVKKMIRFVDLKAINQADAVIIADDSRREQIAGSKPRRLEVIYNSPEEPKGDSETSASLLPNRVGLRIAYVGNLQVERGLFELLEVLRKHPEWRLDLAGFGADEAIIRAEAEQLPNVTWYGSVPYVRALELNQQADVIVITYSPKIPNHRFSSPNKLFEAMLLGKPVIVAGGTNVDRIVQAENCGLVVTYGDVAELEAALQRIEGETELSQQLGRNARKAYESTYAWSNMKGRLLRLYQEVVQ